MPKENKTQQTRKGRPFCRSKHKLLGAKRMNLDSITCEESGLSDW